MNKIILSSVLFAAILVGFSSCHTKDKGSKLNQQFTWEKLAAYEMYADPYVEENWPGEEENMPHCWIHVELLHPSVQDSKYEHLRDSLVKYINERILSYDKQNSSRDETQALLDRYVAIQVEDYKKDVEEAKALDFDVPSYSLFSRQLDLCDSLVYNENGIISITLLAQEYSGGAHGNELLTTLNYNLERKEVITPSVIFSNPHSEGLSTLILQSLMKEFDVTEPEQLELLGVFNYEEIEVTNNFYFTPNGIAFYYNPYELAAYAVGAIELIIPYSDLNPYFSSAYRNLGKI